MKYLLGFIIGLVSFSPQCAFAQKDLKHIREGNQAFAKENYQGAELAYRKALDKTKSPEKPAFNIGDALYKQNKFEDAAGQFDKLAEAETDKESASRIYHNLGNSFLQASKLEESIKAYKNALRNNPYDMETKYNLAYAQEMLEEQKKQDQKNKDNKDNKDKDKDKDKDKQDNKDQNKDKNKEDQDKKDQQKDQDQNKDQKDKQQQQQPNEISKEDASRILQALANQEKDVQDKVKKAKAQKAKVKTTINW